MIKGLYAAASSMVGLEKRHDVIANNLANASTAGYKRSDGAFRGYLESYFGKPVHPSMFDAHRGPGGGMRIVETFTDWNNGPLATTGDPLNVALQGPGFLAVETPEGERFTRNGQLALNNLGQLVTEEGDLVLDQGGGPITPESPDFEIDREGGVSVGGVPIGQLRVVEFAEPGLLERRGRNLYAAPEQAIEETLPADNTVVTHRALEQANVQTPTEMVHLLTGLRAYEANQRVITTHDETMNQLISQVGMPS